MPKTWFPTRALAAGLAIAAVAGLVVWLMATQGWFEPPPTKFGWPATLSTIAGDGVRGASDGAAGGARFSDPFAVAIDRRGALYVADAGDLGRIRKIDTDGTVVTLPGFFDTPSGVAVDRDGNIIVADTGANRVRRIMPGGIVTTIAGDGVPGWRDGPAAQARFNGPTGVAVDNHGNIYVADTYNDRIRLISPDGAVRTLAGGDAPGFVDGAGAAAAFDTPTGIALDRQHRLLVADSGNSAVRIVTSDGSVSTLARSDPDDGAGLLQGLVGLAPTWDGYVYIATYRRGRIVELSPAGALRVLAGPGSTIDGNATLPLVGPAGLAIAPSGELYVADASAYAIRKLAPRLPGAPPASTAPAAALPALARAPLVPWPLKPQSEWHEVVGSMGEVRGNYHGEARDHLHAGLDISAAVGQPVVASADETVRDPLPNWSAGGLGEGLRIDQLTYIHMRVGRTARGEPLDPARFQIIRDPEGHVTRVRVKRGTRFRTGDLLGTINPMAHVHLELGPPQAKINAMALNFPGLADHVAPHIGDVFVVDAAGQRLTAKERGRLIVPVRSPQLPGIVVDAWDQVDNNAARRRLGLYAAGYQILQPDGTPVRGFERPRITIEFDRLPLAADAVKVVYSAASGDAVHGNRGTRLLYVVTNTVRHGRVEPGGWNTAQLAPGDYVIRIYAADRAGNVAASGRDLPVTLR